LKKFSSFSVAVLLIFAALIIYIPNTISQSLSNKKITDYKDVAKQFVRKALEDRKGYHLLKEMTDIGPRLSGSQNSIKAIHWAENKMKELGFDKVWLQSVMVPHWERGNIEKAKIVSSKKFNNRKLIIRALGGSIATPSDGLQGKVISIKSFDELREKQELVKGKIVFFDRPLDQGLYSGGYGGVFTYRVFGADSIAKYGGIGVLLRSITTKYDNNPHTGVVFYADKVERVPAVAVGYLDSDFLGQALIEDPELEVNFKLNSKWFPDAQSYNVIGEITGTKYPDEIITVGGHIDSWDLGVGANDDATGCIQSMEVLDLFKRLNIAPQRTIRCVLFINEENGSRGANAYAQFADSSLQKTIAAMEADAGSGSPRDFSVDSDSLTINKIKSWIPVLSETGILRVRKGGSGADVGGIKSAIARIGYGPDGQRYFDYHHSDNDQFSIIHPREFELGSAAMATLIYMIDQEGL